MNARLAEMFHRLADLPPDARARYFVEHEVDPDTRREVEELLAHDSSDAGWFSQPVGISARAYLDDHVRGTLCGPFRLLHVIGRGGMGVVYLAERADGEVGQRAAVKLLQPGWTEIQRERFLQERDILAALAHPNIARVLDAGHLADGQPYLAMEYVDGQRIEDYCHGLDVRQTVELFLHVCEAVAYLHANSVLHRDLKPGNVLVSASGEVKLLDFGNARMLELGGDPTVTRLRILTPEYASPEQLSGGAVGTRSDVYSLGAVLHHLLSGGSPGEKQPSHSPRELSGDLEIVMQTATRREPEDRYASIEEFSADLRAWLESRPIQARRGDRIYRARKLIQRHGLATGLLAAVVAALLGAGALAWYSSPHDSRVHGLTAKRVTANTPELPIQMAAISRDGAYVAYSDPLGIHLYDTAAGVTRLLEGTAGHVLQRWMPDGSALQTQTLDDSGVAATMIVPAAGGRPELASDGSGFRYSPDRRHRALASADGKQLVVEDADGSRSRELWRSANSVVSGYEWSPDGKALAVVADYGRTSSLEIIDVAGRRKSVLIPASSDRYITSIVWHTTNRIVAAIWERGSGINSEGADNLWQVLLNSRARNGPAELRKLTAWTDSRIRRGSLTTDGRRLALVRTLRQRDVYIAEIGTGGHHAVVPRRLTPDLGDDYPTAWTRDSKAVILTSDRNGSSNVFAQEIDKLSAKQLVHGPGRQILPRVAPDGDKILFYGREARKRGLMRVPVSGGTAELLFETSNVADFRCSPAGPCIIAEFQRDRRIVVSALDLRKGKGREIYREASGRIVTPDISPDGRFLATPSSTKIVVRSFATGSVVREIGVRHGTPATRLTSLDYSPDGRGFYAGDITPNEARLLYIDLTGKASVVYRQAGSLPQIWGIPSPDGKHVAIMMHTDDSNVYLLDGF